MFLEEADEDMEMNDLPLLENTSPLPVLAPVVPSFIPFAIGLQAAKGGSVVDLCSVE